MIDLCLLVLLKWPLVNSEMTFRVARYTAHSRWGAIRSIGGYFIVIIQWIPDIINVIETTSGVSYHRTLLWV